jgi:hypothetical protein
MPDETPPVELWCGCILLGPNAPGASQSTITDPNGDVTAYFYGRLCRSGKVAKWMSNSALHQHLAYVFCTSLESHSNA